MDDDTVRSLLFCIDIADTPQVAVAITCQLSSVKTIGRVKGVIINKRTHHTLPHTLAHDILVVKINTIKGRLSLYIYYFYFHSFVWFSLDLTHLCTTLKTVFRNSLPFARNPASPGLKNAIFISPQIHLFTPDLGGSACVSKKVQDIQLFGIVRSYLALVRDIQSICKRTMPNS